MLIDMVVALYHMCFIGLSFNIKWGGPLKNMNKYKRLLNDSFIYILGSFGSKAVALIMVSFYTFNLTPSEYGVLDVSLTTISLLLPIITCCVQEAVLSFLIKSEYNKSQILTNSIFIFTFNVIVLVIGWIIYDFIGFDFDVKWIVVLVGLEGFNCIILQYCRAVDKTKLYATSGIIVTFVMSLLNINFLKFLKMGLNGYYLAMTIAYLSSVVILFIGSGAWREIKISSLNKKVGKVILLFSCPLIVDSLMWWVMNALDKYFVLYYLGSEWNGIYAVAGKIPTILSTLTNTFIQAWQVSAIIESEARDKNRFYTSVFDGLVFFNVLVISLIFIALKPVLEIFISGNYSDVWKYVPFLLLGSMCLSLSGFLGANYLASQKTRGALVSSIIGGISNFTLNVLFIPLMGLNGAAVATAISFGIVFFVRIYDTRKFVTINYNIQKIFFYCAILCIEVITYYLCDEIITAIVSAVAVIIVLVINIDKIDSAIKIFNKKRHINKCHGVRF